MFYARIGDAIGWLKKRPLVSFIVLHAIILLAVFANLDRIYELVGFGGLEQYFAVKMLEGQLPYTDFTCEYPPLALLSFLLPGLVSTAQPAYGFLFALEMLLLDVAVMFTLWKLATRFKMEVWYILSIYTLCLLAVGVVSTGRFDLLPAALVLLALYAFVSGRNKSAWVVLGLSVSAKLYPLIIAPLFALHLLRHRQYSQLAQGIAVFAGVLLAINLPWIIINADGYWQFLSYHLERGLHSESSYGSLLLMGKVLGLTRVDAVMAYGSWNLVSSLADSLAESSFYITASLLLSAYAVYARQLWKKPAAVDGKEIFSNEAAGLIFRFSIVAVIIMLLASKVFSPQFLIWLCPLIPLVRARWHYVPWLLFLVIGILTQYIYPCHYIEFEYATLGDWRGQSYLIGLLFIRNFLLLAMAAVYLLPLGTSLPAERGFGAAGSPTPSGIV